MDTTNSVFRTAQVYRAFFADALREQRGIEADYAAEVDRWYTEGDGRSREDGGLGYRFPRCPHGMNLWVDYDPICGYCEDGDRTFSNARMVARERWERFMQRMEWVNSAPLDLDYETRKALAEWALSLFPKSK